MKKIGLSLLVIWFMMLLPQGLFPYDRSDFDRIVDFSVTIKTLNQNGEITAIERNRLQPELCQS